MLIDDELDIIILYSSILINFYILQNIKMIDLEYVNNYLDDNYNNKKFKNWFTSFRIEKTKDFLKQFKKEFRDWIDKEYFSSLYIHWRFCDIDKTFIEDDSLENLFKKSIDWIEKHFTK